MKCIGCERNEATDGNSCSECAEHEKRMAKLNAIEAEYGDDPSGMASAIESLREDNAALKDRLDKAIKALRHIKNWTTQKKYEADERVALDVRAFCTSTLESIEKGA